MKPHALAIIAVSMIATAAQAQILNRSSLPAFSASWGVKVGFAATATYITDAIIDGHELTEYTQDTQVGNFAAFLFRLNSRTIFLQSGIGMSYNTSCFYMDLNSWNPEAESKHNISCLFTYKSYTAPLQLGYHIVNRPPYCMSAFTGPRLRYTPYNQYYVQYNYFEPYQLTETPTRLIMGWTAGLSVRIGRMFIDFEYEATINPVSGPIYDTTDAFPEPHYTLDRRLGIMSFSYGIMF